MQSIWPRRALVPPLGYNEAAAPLALSKPDNYALIVLLKLQVEKLSRERYRPRAAAVPASPNDRHLSRQSAPRMSAAAPP